MNGTITIFTKGILLLLVATTLHFPHFVLAQAEPKEPLVLAIKCGQLIDGESDTPMQNAIILVSGKRIEQVGTNIAIPDKARIIDLSDYTVLPGLIDTHTHICLTPENPAGNPVLYKSIPYRTIEGLRGAQLHLEAGFTSLRDVDSEGANFADVAIRNAINDGLTWGPRLQVSTMAISITGGHMNLTGLAPHIEVPQEAAIADSPAEKIKEVRRQIKYGADWIKIYATGTIRHIDRTTLEPLNQVSLAEMKLIVEECNRWRVPVAVHAYGGDGATNAILGGVRSIEHGFFLTEEQLKMMKERGTFWVPTLSVYIPSDEVRRNKVFRQKIIQSHKQTFQNAMKLGVKIAFGTDVSAFAHEPVAREFERMVEYGMSPMNAIKSATSLAAELMHWQEEVGSIKAHKYADIIAVKKNPLSDISELRNVTFVMKGGVIYRENGSMAK